MEWHLSHTRHPTHILYLLRCVRLLGLRSLLAGEVVPIQWRAACTGFFGFLRAGEFTVPSPGAYDKEVHLNLEDLSINSHRNSTMIRVHIKQSKTDPFRQGVDIYLEATGSTLCPVQALWQYLSVRGPAQSPLFMLSYDTPLTRTTLVNRLQQALASSAGIEAASYNGHSFRIGAATTAAKRGVEDSQTLGRWKSTAYLAYIKLPREQLAAISHKLVSYIVIPLYCIVIFSLLTFCLFVWAQRSAWQAIIAHGN